MGNELSNILLKILTHEEKANTTTTTNNAGSLCCATYTSWWITSYCCNALHLSLSDLLAGRGMWTNRRTTFINASVCSNKYKPDHDPIVFDFPLPSGYSRKDFAHLSTERLRQVRKRTTTLAEQCDCDQAAKSIKDANGVAADSRVERKSLLRNSADFQNCLTRRFASIKLW